MNFRLFGFFDALLHTSYKIYATDVQNGKNQSNCVTSYPSVIGYVVCFDTPQGKKPVYLSKKKA